MLTVLAFVVTIIIIVAFHEWGHFLAMRAFGVRVLTFSVGFGPKILRFTDKKGTEWTISAVPLGGYVKPLDCRDDETAVGAPGEFSAKPAWQRVITYAAGPGFNFILALLIYWLMMFSYGQSGWQAVVGTVTQDSVAAQGGFQPGDRIQAVADEPLEGWSEFNKALIMHLGEAGPVPVKVITAQGQTATRPLDIGPWSEEPDQPPMQMLGLNMAVLVGEVQEGSAAELAGLRVNDQIIALDGLPVLGWRSWQEKVAASAGQSLQLTLLRDGRSENVIVTPKAVTEQGQTFGRIGVLMGGTYQQQYGPLQSLTAGVDAFVEQLELVWAGLVKLVTGKLSLKHIGGPITIAEVAGESASYGMAAFLGLLAYLSITLGVVNLLPVPMLDGGWILFGIIEMIRGRSLPERFLLAAQSIGLTLVVSFMLLAIYNDLVKQFS